MAKNDTKNDITQYKEEFEQEPSWLRIGDVVNIINQAPQQIEVDGKYGKQKVLKIEIKTVSGNVGYVLASKKQYLDIANAFEKADMPEILTYVRRQ
jgi:hypothetical protein